MLTLVCVEVEAGELFTAVFNVDTENRLELAKIAESRGLDPEEYILIGPDGLQDSFGPEHLDQLTNDQYQAVLDKAKNSQ